MENKTKSWSGLVLGGLMMAIAGFLVGGYGGSQLAATYLVNQHLNKGARDVQKQINALRHLQAGNIPAAIESLESHLDNDLILFDPREPYEGLSEQTQASIEDAVKLAKVYRQEYPRHSKRITVDEMVNNLFDKFK